uniref:DUF3752 domain-containing protein n=1 Tax=Parasteatoda tepidariorum TaxID=114398 RepID=A0A2L2YF93_PARTP
MDLYGPPLPPGYVKPSDDGIDSTNYISKSSELPIASEKKDRLSAPMIGPALPEHLQQEHQQDDSSLFEMCGPSLDEFGTEIDAADDRKADIIKKAQKMKHKLDNKNVEMHKVEREEWMIVPNTSQKNQLGAISRCLAPPSKEKKREHVKHSEKDKKTSEELKKYNKSRRAESLMDMHAKKLKNKEKSEKSKRKEERKAFDRDEMDVRHFTKQQVNSVIDKAKFLNSRFASSSVDKYL